MIGFKNKYKEARFLNRWLPLSIFFLIAILISYFFLDKPLAFCFQDISSITYKTFKIISKIIDPVPHVLLWPIICFFTWFVFKNKNWGHRLLLITFAINLCSLLVIPLKAIFGRYRPGLLCAKGYYGFDLLSLHREEFYSFPSGHAMVPFVLAGCFAVFYPRYSYHCMILALLISFSRVLVNAHFLSDILASGWIGLLISQWIYSTMKESHLNFETSK